MMSLRITINIVGVICIPLITCALYFLGSCTSESSTHAEYYQNGSIKTSYQSIDDSIVLIKDYFKNQKIKNISTLVNGNLKGISEEFNMQGKLVAKIRWLNDKRHGRCYYYYPSGNLHQIANFKNGIPAGDLFEFFDHPNQKIHFRTKFIILNGEKYTNEFYEYDRNGKLIKATPIVRSSCKVNYDSCVAHLKIRMDSADFSRITVFTGGLDKDYQVNDSTLLKSYDSKNLTVNFKVKLTEREDSVLRGIVYNYNIVRSDKKGLTKLVGKNIYWSLPLEDCKRPEIVLAIKK